MTPEQIAKSNSEHAHQCALFAWAALNREKYPMLEYMFAIKNAEKAGKVAGAMAKAEGVKAGVLDIFLPYPNGDYHGLFIEMKRPKTEKQEAGKLSKEQIQFMKYAESVGYARAVCHSWQDAACIIQSYLSL